MASNSAFARAARACRRKHPKAAGKVVFRCIKAAGGLAGGKRKGSSKGGRRRSAATPSQYAAQRRLATASRSCSHEGKKGRSFQTCVKARIGVLTRGAKH